MSKNILQVYIDNPIVTNQPTDLMYFGRSPYGTGDDTAMLFSSFAAQFFSGSVPSIQGTANQVLVNGTTGVPISGMPVTLTTPQDIASSSSPEFFDLTLSNGNLFDANANIVCQFEAGNIAAENYVRITNQISGMAPGFSISGIDANIGLGLNTKGTGRFQFATANATPFAISCGTGYQHSTFIAFADTANIQTITFQDGNGTVAFLSDIPSVMPSALTKVDDTNVTVTLGGSPAVALLAATSITMGWTGQLSLTRGGTNKSLIADNGGIVYSDADSLEILAATATARQMLQSGASGAPAWSTTTYPATNAINTIMYASSANVLGSIAAANSSVLITGATGVPVLSGALTNGQLIIGSTGAQPVVANLTAGSGISISNTAGGITISGTGSGTGFTEVTGTSQSMAADAGYVTNNVGLVTLTLPAVAAFGTAITVIGKGAGGWRIAQNAGQTIQVGSSVTTTGVGGSVSSTNQFDSIDLVCVTANTAWVTWGAPQSAGLTIV